MPEAEVQSQGEVVEEVEVNAPPTGLLATIQGAVNVSTSAKDAESEIIKQLSQELLEERTGLFRKCIEALKKHRAELNKLKPKSPGFDEKFVPLPKVFSSDDKKKIDQLTAKIKTLEAGYTKLFGAQVTEQDWKKFDELVTKNS